jgi:hypothetical protein
VAATLTAAAAALVLLDAVVAVLIVYAASFFVDEDLISFRYCNELVVGAVVASVGMY